MPPIQLKAEACYRACHPQALAFKTTDDLEEIAGFLGQERALEAVEFATSVDDSGFNLFVMGSAGSGRHSVIKRFLEQRTEKSATPDDWCYVNNFHDPHKPVALAFPPGQAAAFKQEMDDLVEALKEAIPAAFESEEYAQKKKAIEEELKHKSEKAYDDLEAEAKKRNIAMVRTNRGLMFAPFRNDGEIMTPEEFSQLSDTLRDAVEKEIEALQEKLRATIASVTQWKQENKEALKKLGEQVALGAAGRLLEELKHKHEDREKVIAWLDDVLEEVIRHVDDFTFKEENAQPLMIGGLTLGKGQGPHFREFQVNVLVAREAEEGVPVVYEDLPNYQNLNGRVEHQAQMGMMVTDFTMIKSGCLHRANGGYLVLDAMRLLTQPFAWDALKRSLRSGEIRMESVEKLLSLMSTVTLEPEPIPLEVKVILVGERFLYYLLYHYDPDFKELFKVEADFEEEIDRSPESEKLYASLIATIARKNGLLPLSADAVGRVMEQSARLADDSEKLSIHVRSIKDLMKEAQYHAEKAGASAIEKAHIQAAVDSKLRRSGRIKDRYRELIEKGTILIDTDGAKPGQVNGLSIVAFGNMNFGHPSRITARTRPGKGEVVNIEREVEMSGPIHSKGVMIITGLLGSRYAADKPLTLSATLVFEQSYGGVDGDSASMAELVAILSDLSGVPIDQSLAITGSVNQAGEVQAIGGVNDKIEGFFDVCTARGLTGRQGVVIPHTNVKHLMLRRDVVEAVEAGTFRIIPIKNLDDAIEALTGETAGARDESGAYPEDSVNGKVEAALIRYARLIQEFNNPDKNEGSA